MTDGEKLMLLIEECGFDVTKYRLKKQLEFEKRGNLELFRQKTLSDLLKVNYDNNFEEVDFHRLNPLTFSDKWDCDIHNIDEFYMSHSDVNGEMIIKDFLACKEVSLIMKEAILYDVFDVWVDEYRDYSIQTMENLYNMIELLPKKSKKYRAPSRIFRFITLIFMAVLILTYKNPDILQLGFFTDINALLYSNNWYSFFGLAVTVLTSTYWVFTSTLSRFVKDTKGEKNKKIKKTFKKWEEEMKQIRLEQSGVVEEYVDMVIEHPEQSGMNIHKLIGPEKFIQKIKRYVRTVEMKFDYMIKYYPKIRMWLRVVLFFVLLLTIGFYVLGYMIKGGVL